MLTFLLAATSIAATPTDDQVHTMVEQVLKRRLPADATCMVRPELPDLFRDVVVVGLRKQGVGCSVLVTHVGDSLRKPEQSATAAIVASKWKAATPAERAEALQGWTEGVLLAFASPEEALTSRVRGDKAIVQGKYLHRLGGDGVSASSTGVFTFDVNNGKLLDQQETPSQYYRTALTVRPERVTGNLTNESVSEALSSKGRVIKRCFVDAWERDLALNGRVRLSWTVAEGKTEELAVMGGDDAPEELAKCYAFRAVKDIEWPESAAGTVQWVFVARRGRTDPPKN